MNRNKIQRFYREEGCWCASCVGGGRWRAHGRTADSGRSGRSLVGRLRPRPFRPGPAVPDIQLEQ